MKLATFWLVRDPCPVSELVDIVWEQDVARLGDYMRGSDCVGPRTWERENHTIYTEKDEAIRDAIARLTKMNPAREGWIMAEAHEAFGYGTK